MLNENESAWLVNGANEIDKTDTIEMICRFIFMRYSPKVILATEYIDKVVY